VIEKASKLTIAGSFSLLLTFTQCIRIADSETKHLMVEEIIYCPDFERLVDDAFANYVVQTAVSARHL